VIEHIPGKLNVVADGMTRVHQSQLMEIQPKNVICMRMIPSLVSFAWKARMNGISDQECYVLSDEKDWEQFEGKGIIERHSIFAKFIIR
jgi:hypothetical protein